MTKPASVALRKLPSVDEVLRTAAAVEAVDRFGRSAVVAAVRETLAAARAESRAAGDANEIAARPHARGLKCWSSRISSRYST